MNFEDFQEAPAIVGEDDEDTQLLGEMLREAREYISAFEWCPPITAIYLGFGVGGVVAAFLFRFAHKIDDGDDMLWVIVGDLPSAYLVVLPEDGPPYALERYCELMEDWVDAVRDGGSLDDVFPVAADPTAEHAEMLARRIGTLRDEIIPYARAS